jgi:hypothetical protein
MADVSLTLEFHLTQVDPGKDFVFPKQKKLSSEATW